MRKETFEIYVGSLDTNIEREFTIYSKSELIDYIKNHDMKDYEIECGCPRSLRCEVEIIDRRFDDIDEFFIVEEDKIIYNIFE